MKSIKNVVSQEVVNKFKEISGKIVTIHNENENFKSENIYEQLECAIDDCCIYLGESIKENYDYSVFLHNIENIVIEDDNILIKFLDGNCLLIVVDS